MNLIYLALGSNLCTPERQLRLGIKALKTLPNTSVIAVAPFYFNVAYGHKAQPNYCNTVVKILTNLDPDLLLSLCHKIERRHGRVRRIKWGARTLDIDIILYAQRKIVSKNLIIPHKNYLERDFVCIPLKHLDTQVFGA